jgi:hypothetical protein
MLCSQGKIGYLTEMKCKSITYNNWRPHPSCETVALRESFIDRPESYDSFSAKSCVFLAHVLGVYFSILLHNLAQCKISQIPKTFTNYSRTITNLTKFDFPLPRDQTSRSRISQMISEKFKCVTFKAALDDVRYS